MGAQTELYLGLYLPTSGGLVLLAWASCQASLDVALKEDVTFYLNLLSFNISMPSCTLILPLTIECEPLPLVVS